MTKDNPVTWRQVRKIFLSIFIGIIIGFSYIVVYAIGHNDGIEKIVKLESISHHPYIELGYTYK